MRTPSFLAFLAIASLALLSAQGQFAHAAATINGHIEPTGSLKSGDKATLVLDFSTSPVFGNEYLDENGRFRFETHITLRLAGQQEVEPRNYDDVRFIAPKTDHFSVRYEIPHELSIGKWVVNATVKQEMLHDMTTVGMNPDRWEFDVVAPEKSWFQQVWESFTTVPAAIVVAAVGLGLGIWHAKWSKKQSRTSMANKPVFHWEWFDEGTPGSNDRITKIRIRLVENHADRVRVFVEGTQLSWERSGDFEFNMTAGAGGNLVIPKHLVSPDSEVSLRWGENTSKSASLRGIPKVNG